MFVWTLKSNKYWLHWHILARFVEKLVTAYFLGHRVYTMAHYGLQLIRLFICRRVCVRHRDSQLKHNVT